MVRHNTISNKIVNIEGKNKNAKKTIQTQTYIHTYTHTRI